MMWCIMAMVVDKISLSLEIFIIVFHQDSSCLNHHVPNAPIHDSFSAPVSADR